MDKWYFRLLVLPVLAVVSVMALLCVLLVWVADPSVLKVKLGNWDEV